MKAGPPNEVKSSPAIVSRYTRKKIALAAGDNVSRPFLKREQALGFDAAKENASVEGRRPSTMRLPWLQCNSADLHSAWTPFVVSRPTDHYQQSE
jgi:hypothetical protein